MILVNVGNGAKLNSMVVSLAEHGFELRHTKIMGLSVIYGAVTLLL